MPLKIGVVAIMCAVLGVSDVLGAAEWETNPEVKLPPGMVECRISNPNRDECVKNMLTDLVPRLKDGYEPFGLPPIDPYFVHSLVFNHRNGDNSMRAETRNLTIHGLTGMKIKNYRSQFSNDGIHLEVDVLIPIVRIQGLYRGEGNINRLKVKAKGRLNITVTDMTTTMYADGKYETRNGEQYMTIKSFNVKPKIRGFNFHATGLFPNPELNDIVLQVINQNWEAVFEIVLPESRPVWEPLGLDLLNAVMGRVPFRRISPP